jgi:hypothetical protein
MKLHVGERLPGTGLPSQPGGYLVTGVAAETPWYGLYTGKKIFYNFDFTAKRFREADDKEWLDVYLRTVNYPRLDDPDYVAGRRALSRAEARRILGNRTSNLWPEPLDLLEVVNTRDPFTFARTPGASPAAAQELEPVVVFARPQGEALVRWQQGMPPLAAGLAALAELLDFIRAAHGDGLLLNGLGPGNVLVDRVGRVHYLGTEMVVEMKQASQLAGGPAAGARIDWARFFPPERYPRGFSAPECFDPGQPRDRRTDLYAWATLAYLLLTGDRPPQLALSQGQPWARFQDAQFARLDRAMRAVPPVHVRNWAEQMGVAADALARDWPRNFLTVLQLCLRLDPRQRPASVADLRAWLLAPPPPAVPAAVALRLPGGAVRVFLDVRALEPGLEVMVRRAAGVPPTTAEDGQAVAEGPPRPWFDDPAPPPDGADGPVRYAAFTRARHAGGVSSSVATPAELVEPVASSLRRFAEAGAPPGTPDEAEPRTVGLLFEALDLAKVAEALLASALPQVRGWAVRRLARPGRPPAAQTLLWHALQDPAPALRLEAARGLLDGSARPPLHLVRKVAETLGAHNLDDAITAARSLRQIGVAEDVIRATVIALEGERPTNCPVCGLELAGRDRAGHLAQVHDYVDVFGTLLPRPAALARLWDRVFSAADAPAHDRLAEVLLGGKSGPAYAAALEAELARRADGLFAARFQEVPRLVRCLRQSAAARPHFPRLLRSADSRVREVGRELLLPDLGEALAGDKVTAADIRRRLDELGPDLLDEKIQLCLRLPHAGVDAAAAEECLRRLQDERPVPCPHCGSFVPQGQLATHLRQAHRIYQFRGGQRTLPDTLAVLLGALCGPSPDYEAWQTLESIAREEYGAGTDALLAGMLGKALAAVADRRQQDLAVSAAAEAVAAGASGPRLVGLLVNPDTVTEAAAVSRRLALAVATRLPPPLDGGLVAAVRPLLSDRSLAFEARLEAAAALLRSTGKEGAVATEVLSALVAGSGKAKAVERLRLLEQRVGTAPAIDALCFQLEEQIRMRCPRCPVQLRRPQMRKHLWDEHRLVLDGRRVREPWRLVEDWIEDYRLEKDAEVLGRCRELARRLDPEHGLLRVQRLLLRHGIDDHEALQTLLGTARRHRASLCPHCYALVPVREPAPPAALNLSRGRLSARGYRVEVSDAGLFRGLEVETPRGTVYRGTEPDRKLTRKGATVLLVGPPVLAALCLAVLLSAWSVPPLFPVAALLGLALILALVVYLGWRAPEDPLGRAVDHAWTVLVPELHADGFAADDSAFAAGLALASVGLGRPQERSENLEELIARTDKAVAAGEAPPTHLGALWRLAAEDRAAAGGDPVPLLVRQVGRCFEGKIPLDFAVPLLAPGDTPWWTDGNRNRLRVLLCDQAFEAGLEFHDLVEVGRATPALGAALDVEDPGALARLRLLWSLRPTRPWDRCGEAVTVFELAADLEEAERRLAKFPDMLLAVLEAPVIYLCGRGLIFLDTLFTEPPQSVEVVERRFAHGGGYVLIVGDHDFRLPEDPGNLAVRLERWFRYFFHDFLPQVSAVYKWRSPVVARTLRAQNAVPCPECRQAVLTRTGDVGIAMDEEEARTPAPVVAQSI